MKMRCKLAMLSCLLLGSTVLHVELQSANAGPVMPWAGRLESPTTQPPVREKNADDPLPITPRDDVDDRLFLVRALETLYDRWPIPNGNVAELERAVDELRGDAHRHAEYIRLRELGPELASCFDDVAALLDSYKQAAARVGRIGREGAAGIEKQRSDDLAKASVNGGFDAGGALATGANGKEALAIWALSTSLRFLVANNGKAERVNEATREAIERIVREYDDEHSRAVARAQSLGIALGEKYGWKPGECGLDSSRDQAHHALDVIERRDLVELARLLDIARHRRPRDPFALVASTLCSLRAKEEADITADDVRRALDRCLDAAAMVPKGPFYDPYRSDIIGLAGILADGVIEKEAASGGWISAPMPSAARAVRIWRTYLAYDPADSSGDGREGLAWALAGAGRFDDALALLSEIVELKRSEAAYAYGLACVLSIKSRTGEAMDWLGQAIKAGWTDIPHARSDPDLAALRAEKGDRFKELTELKFDWSIDWGIISDDIVLTNRSAFALTDVKVTVTVASRGYANWVQTLEVPSLAPGQTHRWNTRISSRGETIERAVSLSADQNP